MKEKEFEALRARQKALDKRVFDILSRVVNLEKIVLNKDKESGQVFAENKSVVFGDSIKAFMHKYAKDKCGSKKFTLLVAFLAKGVVGKEVERKELNGHWDKMKFLLGPPNPFHLYAAENAEWIIAKKRGTYCLTDKWKEVL